MEMSPLKKSYDELDARVKELENENQDLREKVLGLQLAVQTFDAFLKPVEKNCASGCRCSRSTSTEDVL